MNSRLLKLKSLFFWAHSTHFWVFKPQKSTKTSPPGRASPHSKARGWRSLGRGKGAGTVSSADRLFYVDCLLWLIDLSGQHETKCFKPRVGVAVVWLSIRLASRCFMLQLPARVTSKFEECSQTWCSFISSYIPVVLPGLMTFIRKFGIPIKQPVGLT